MEIKRKQLKIFFAVLVLFFALYHPSIQYFLYKIGLSTPAEFGNLEFILGDGWYPVAYSEAGLGRLIFYDSVRPRLVLAKASFPLPGKDNAVAIVKSPPMKGDIKEIRRNIMAFYETYPWGRADFVRRDITHSSSEDLAYLEDFDIYVGVDSGNTQALRNALKELVDVRRKVVFQKQEEKSQKTE